MKVSREHLLGSIGALLAAVAVAAGAAFATTQVNTDHRILKASKGKSIPSQLNGKEKIVTVAASQPPPMLVPPPPGRDPLEWLTELVDAVVVVEIVDKKGAFTPEKDWVESRVNAKIVEVLKRTDKKRFNVTEAFTFVENGGTFKHGATEIRALLPWADPVSVGSQYMVFVQVDQQGNLVIGNSSFYKRTTAGFESLMANPPAPLGKFGPSSEVVMQKIKAMSR